MTTNPKTLADLKPGDAAMTTTEKLHRIRARCVELLEIASKRTQGAWHLRSGDYSDIMSSNNEHCVATTYGCYMGREDKVRNTTFIAASAGAAEAGWKTTISAIDGLLDMANHPLTAGVERGVANAILVNILTAWEGVL